MKQLTCEMCGSTDIVKQDGVFVCQTCGCKYSVEEARKMMIEGTVDVRGTVQVDNSAYVKKYLENARRAKNKEDWEETEKYYNMVEQNDPNNIEAIFYSAFGKAKATLIDGDMFKRQAAFNVLQNCISIIDDNFDPSREDENESAIVSMSADLCKMILSDFVFTEWKNDYGIVTKTNKQETFNLFSGLIVKFKESIENIANIADAVYLHNALILLLETASATGNYNSRMLNDWIRTEHSRVDRINEEKAEKYWAEHQEEKAQLENEVNYLISQIDSLNKDLGNLPEVSAVNRIEEQITQLQEKKDALGIFKSKERKALQEEIDNLKLSLSSAKSEKEKAIGLIQDEIGKKQGRVEEIYSKLTHIL